MGNDISLIPIEQIVNMIFVFRNRKVMLDSDLAELYGIETKQLKRAVRRNIDRFPDDFMFELNKEEHNSLRRQIGTLKRGEHSKYPPFAFTEHGAVMLATVLKSEIASKMSVFIVRAFVELRNVKQLSSRMDKIEKRMQIQDSNIQSLIFAVNKLIGQQKRGHIDRKEVKGFRK